MRPARSGPVTAAGWTVTPAGRQFGISPAATGFQGPLASALTPGATKLLAVSSGASRSNTADLFDLKRRRRASYLRYDARRGIGEAVFYGVAISPDGRRAWASGGGQDVVHAYSIGSTLRETATIPVPSFPAGMAYGRTPRGDRLYVANNLNGRASDTNPPGRTVTVIDPATNGVTSVIDLGVAAQPFGVDVRAQRPQGVRDAVAGPLGVRDRHRHGDDGPPDHAVAGDPPAAGRPPVGDRRQPQARRGLHGERELRHGLGDRHAPRPRSSATIDVSLVWNAREGAMPNGLTVSPDGKRLYVALGGENALAVIDVAKRKVIGFIPTAWYPVDVDIEPGRQAARGHGRQPRRRQAQPLRRALRGRRLQLRRPDLRRRGGRLDADDDEGRDQHDARPADDQGAAQAHAPRAEEQPRARAAPAPPELALSRSST